MAILILILFLLIIYIIRNYIGDLIVFVDEKDNELYLSANLNKDPVSIINKRYVILRVKSK